MTVFAYLVELTLTSPGGDPVTVGLSDVPVRPFPSSDPDRPGQGYLPILAEAPVITRDAFIDLTRGAGGLGRGELSAANAEGDLTAFRGHAVTAIDVRWGPVGGAWADYVALLAARGEAARFAVSTEQPSRVTIPLFDERAILEQNAARATFAGTNTGATGYESTPDALQGQGKPEAWGDLSRAHVPAVWANAVRQVAQLHNGPIDALLTIADRGQDAGLVNAGDFSGADFDTLMLNTGAYATDKGRGLVLIEAGLSGPVTFTLRGDAAGGFVDTVPALMKRLLQAWGVPASRIGDSFDALDAPQRVGVWVQGTEPRRQILDLLCRSIGAWCLPDALGVWQIGLLRPPQGTPLDTWTEHDLVAIATGDPAIEVPAWKITVRYARNLTPLRESDIAPALTDPASADHDPELVAELREPWRRVVWQDDTIKAAWPTAREITVDTALVERADAQVLLDDVLVPFHGVPRQELELVRELTPAALGRALGDEIRVDYPPQGIDAGMILTSIAPAAPDRHLVTFKAAG